MIKYIENNDSAIIRIPKEFRNNNWGEEYGEVQFRLRSITTDLKSLLIDFTESCWVDPLPILSLVISAGEVNSKGVHVELLLPNARNACIEQKRMLAYLFKEGFMDAFKGVGSDIYIYSKERCEKKNVDNDYIKLIKRYERLLIYSDSTILTAHVIDLSIGEVAEKGIERYIDDELSKVRHRFKTKMLDVIEKPKLSDSIKTDPDPYPILA